MALFSRGLGEGRDCGGLALEVALPGGFRDGGIRVRGDGLLASNLIL
jgi:hypothetical protein